MFIVALLLPFSGAQAQESFDVVHAFKGLASTEPNQLISGGDGYFYAILNYAGLDTLVRMSPDGQFTITHTFGGDTPDSNRGVSQFFKGLDGDLYVLTYGGETGSRLFRMGRDGTFTIVYAFDPRASVTLFQDPDGNFYGFTLGDGTARYGTIFRLTPGGTFTVLHDFLGRGTVAGEADGSAPIFLVRGQDGNFYGLTNGGGANGGGTFFRVTEAGATTILHSFVSQSYLGLPGRPGSQLFVGNDGNFYTHNGSEIAELAPSGAVRVLIRVGLVPIAQMWRGPDGNVYAFIPGAYIGFGRYTQPATLKISSGTLSTVTPPFEQPRSLTANGGTQYGTTESTLYTQSPDGTTRVVWTFNTDGEYGSNPVIRASSADALYISTSAGWFRFRRASNGEATLTRLRFTWTGPLAEPAGPIGILVPDPDGNLYGVTAAGGTFGRGTIFRRGQDKSVAVLYSFGGDDGTTPGTLIRASDGHYYGTSRTGGSASLGMLFRLTSEGLMTVLHHFTGGADGGYPTSLLQATDGNLYGTTAPTCTTCAAGLSSTGTIFRLPLGGSVATIHRMEAQTEGYSPTAIVEAPDGSFYGSAVRSENNQGTIFRMSRDGFMSIIFQGTDYHPFRSVLPGRSDGVYGTTDGEIFHVTASGLVRWQHPLNSGSEGSGLQGGLMQGSDGNLYTVAAYGGAGQQGAILQVSPAGAVTVLYAFPSLSNLKSSVSGLIQSPDGGIYGTASSGGVGAGGMIFHVTVTPRAPAFAKQPASAGVIPGSVATFTVAASGSPAPTYHWETSTDGSTWTRLTDRTPYSGTTTETLTLATVSASLYGTLYRAIATNNFGAATSRTVTLAPQPTMALDRRALPFAAAIKNGSLRAYTDDQFVRLIEAGVGQVTWTATSNQPWLVVAPESGTGPAILKIAMRDFQIPRDAGTSQGMIRISLAGAANTVLEIAVTLTVLPPDSATVPFGRFDTPETGPQSLSGSIAVTGWALDDVVVNRVEVWRDLQPGETTVPFDAPPSDPRSGKIFIGKATFVDGARPDVEGLNQTTPFSYRAGWGYLLLTWGLWNQGNGTYTLHAIAFDDEGNVTSLGSKTVLVNNETAAKPFGAIDTPAMGGDAGTGANSGWALTPKVGGVATCKIPPGGVQVSIDSGPLQPVVYGDARTDIAATFPGFSNGSAAGGHAVVDWSALTTGVHTIAWLVSDDCNRADGIGSRFFNVTSGSAATASSTALPVAAQVAGEIESETPITVAYGYGELPKVLDPVMTGSHIVEVKQGERIEIRVPRGFEAAYQIGPAGQRRALPTGATWDAASATFSWQPAVGFLGRYRLVFSSGRERISVRIVVTP